MRILVTRNFDTLDIIGYISLREGVEIPPNSVFSLGYTILEGTRSNPTKIHVQSVSLIPDSSFSRYLAEQEKQAEEKPMPEQPKTPEPVKLVDASGMSVPLPPSYFTLNEQNYAIYAVLTDEQWQKLEVLIRRIVSEEIAKSLKQFTER